MQEIEKIYHNDFGIGFYWKKHTELPDKKVQLVFRDTGFYLNLTQLKEFESILDRTQQNLISHSCSHYCRSILLKTPAQCMELAVNKTELNGINDLVKGVLFKIEMRRLIEDICEN